MASMEATQGSGAMRSVIDKLRLMFGRSSRPEHFRCRVDELDRHLRADIGIGDHGGADELTGRERFWRAGNRLRHML